MYITELDFLAGQERYYDLLKDAENERLIQAAGLRPSAAKMLVQKTVDWLGAQMVRLRCALTRRRAVPACRLDLPA